jgi:hypothetical protein
MARIIQGRTDAGLEAPMRRRLIAGKGQAHAPLYKVLSRRLSGLHRLYALAIQGAIPQSREFYKVQHKVLHERQGAKFAQ